MLNKIYQHILKVDWNLYRNEYFDSCLTLILVWVTRMLTVWNLRKSLHYMKLEWQQMAFDAFVMQCCLDPQWKGLWCYFAICVSINSVWVSWFYLNARVAKLSKEREASQIKSIQLQIISLLWKVLISFYKLCQIYNIDIAMSTVEE